MKLHPGWQPVEWDLPGSESGAAGLGLWLSLGDLWGVSQPCLGSFSHLWDQKNHPVLRPLRLVEASSKLMDHIQLLYAHKLFQTLTLSFQFITCFSTCFKISYCKSSPLYCSFLLCVPKVFSSMIHSIKYILKHLFIYLFSGSWLWHMGSLAVACRI